MVKLAKRNELRVARRISIYEKYYSNLPLIESLDWVWLDLFTNQIPLTNQEYRELKQKNIKICLVSPELHGRDITSTHVVKEALDEKHIKMDAVCTKYPHLW